MSLLELHGVSRRFGALEALSDIDLAVAEGELRAVIGPNGAGKTTLFNLVSGLLPPSSGRIIFDGREITGVRPAQLVTRGIVRTFQITQIFPDLTVFENLRLAVEAAMGLTFRPFLGAAGRREVTRRAEDLLEAVHLSDKADRVASELAHGDQRIVEMGITLSREPRLLLLDEPTAGMGDEETAQMVEIIRHLNRERGITMLFIEHHMEIVFGIADRITVLDNGTMLAEGTAEEVASNEAVQAAYLGHQK